MKTPTAKLINPNLPTVSMPGMSSPLILFLASIKAGVPSVLRYGNRTQAETKLAKVLETLSAEGNAAAVVQVESRFLIATFPAEYDLDQKSGELVKARKFLRYDRSLSLADSMISMGKAAGEAAKSVQRFGAAYRKGISRPISTRPPFATVSGRRLNPRNRHNQNLPDHGPGPVYCQQGSISQLEAAVVADLLAKGTARDRRAAYRAVSDRLNGRGQ